MEKTRVKKGETYWYIDSHLGNFSAVCRCDNNDIFSYEKYIDGNYFHNEEDVRYMLRKLDAVLKGAEVIEMPNKKEIEATQDRIEHEVVFNIRDINGSQFIYCTAINKGAELMADWFKSKIVK